MYKKPLYKVCSGSLVQASVSGGDAVVVTRENGRILRRQMSLPVGKVYGARAVSYADAYFEFPFATLEVIGEERIYERKA